MQGERSNEEKIALEAKIKDLNEDLEQRNNTHTLLTLQLKRLQVCTVLLKTFCSCIWNLSLWRNSKLMTHHTLRGFSPSIIPG